MYRPGTGQNGHRPEQPTPPYLPSRPCSGTRDWRLVQNERLLTVPYVSLVLDRAGVEQAGVDQDGGDAVLGREREGEVLLPGRVGNVLDRDAGHVSERVEPDRVQGRVVPVSGEHVRGHVDRVAVVRDIGAAGAVGVELVQQRPGVFGQRRQRLDRLERVGRLDVMLQI